MQRSRTPTPISPTSAARRGATRGCCDVGDTLLEILFAVVIIGLTVAALMSSLANAGNAANVQRNSVQVDLVMRNFAEATKSAVQNCVAGGTYTVTYTPPAGFAASATPAGNQCPTVSTPVVLQLNVTAPLGLRQAMQIRIRTP